MLPYDHLVKPLTMHLGWIFPCPGVYYYYLVRNVYTRVAYLPKCTVFRYKRHEVQKRFIFCYKKKHHQPTSILFLCQTCFFLSFLNRSRGFQFNLWSVLSVHLLDIFTDVHVAYALTLLHGRAGLSGWQWIFVCILLLTSILMLTWLLTTDYRRHYYYCFRPPYVFICPRFP